MTILGGIWSDPGDRRINSGYNLRKTADILFTAAIVAIFGIAVILISKSATPDQRRDPMLVQTVVVMPFMLLRSGFATAEAFISDPSNIGQNIWLYLALLQIPDLTATTIYTFYGFYLLRPSQRREVARNQIQELGTQTPRGIRRWFRRRGQSHGLDGDKIDY
jgi:hypothetical protein